MSTTVKAPNPDDVFDKWLQGAPLKKLEKYFAVKGVKFQKGNISKAKVVKNIIDSVVFYFKSKIEEVPKVSSKAEEHNVSPSSIKKVYFYEFGKFKVDARDWKGKDMVPFANSIKKVPCEKKCDKGSETCPSCKGEGKINCKKCKGSGSFKCRYCNGTGVEEVFLKVGEASEKKVVDTKRPLKHQCPACQGTGTEYCTSCYGMGYNLCDKCKGARKTTCKRCSGYGFEYTYRVLPVPYGIPTGPDKYEHYLFFNKDVEKVVKEDLGEEINQSRVHGITIRKTDDLHERFVKANLGVYDKEIASRLKECQKTWKALEKQGMESPMFPIYAFPVILMNVITESNKKFDIVSIGTDNGFKIYAPRFK